jgi:hypothetical protein
MENEDLDWAKALADERAWVLHLETRTVGRVEALYDGEGNRYTPPGQARALRDAVLKLEGGHTFLAKPGSFARFEAAEAQLYVAAVEAVREAVAGMARLGTASGVKQTTGLLLIAAALRAQLRELERTHPTSRAPAGD